MSTFNWRVIEKLDIRGEEAHWPWLLAAPVLQDLTHLRITAQGSWQPVGSQLMPFSPDGHVGLPIEPAWLVLPTCPPGALIGRIGGGSAGFQNPAPAGAALAPEQPFPIGRYCLVALGASGTATTLCGPLFVGFNWILRPLHIVSLKLVVEGAVVS